MPQIVETEVCYTRFITGCKERFSHIPVRLTLFITEDILTFRIFKNADDRLLDNFIHRHFPLLAVLGILDRWIY